MTVRRGAGAESGHAFLILLLSCAAFGSALSARVMDAQLPRLAADFDVGLAAAAQAITVFSVAYGALQLVYGPLGDRYGKWRVITGAALACSATAAACALADGYAALLAARALAGATCAAVIPLAMAWIGDAIPYERRQPVLARFLTGQIVGFAGGQLAGGMAADFASWRVPFVALALWFALIGLALAATLNRAERAAPPQRSGRGPVQDALHVLRVPWARVVLAVVFIEGAVLFGPFAFFASHLHHRFALTLGAAGASLMPYAAGGLLFAWLSGVFLRRLGEAGLARGGGLLVATGFCAMALSPVWWTAPIAALLAGLGFYMFHNTLQTNATQMAPALRGVAVSLFAAAFFLGQTLGVALCGPLVEWLGGAPVFVAGALALAALAFAFARRKDAQPRVQPLSGRP